MGLHACIEMVEEHALSWMLYGTSKMCHPLTGQFRWQQMQFEAGPRRIKDYVRTGKQGKAPFLLLIATPFSPIFSPFLRLFSYLSTLTSVPFYAPLSCPWNISDSKCVCSFNVLQLKRIWLNSTISKSATRKNMNISSNNLVIIKSHTDNGNRPTARQ